MGRNVATDFSSQLATNVTDLLVEIKHEEQAAGNDVPVKIVKWTFSFEGSSSCKYALHYKYGHLGVKEAVKQAVSDIKGVYRSFRKSGLDISQAWSKTCKHFHGLREKYREERDERNKQAKANAGKAVEDAPVRAPARDHSVSPARPAASGSAQRKAVAAADEEDVAAVEQELAKKQRELAEKLAKIERLDLERKLREADLKLSQIESSSRRVGAPRSKAALRTKHVRADSDEDDFDVVPVIDEDASQVRAGYVTAHE